MIRNDEGRLVASMITRTTEAQNKGTLKYPRSTRCPAARPCAAPFAVSCEPREARIILTGMNMRAYWACKYTSAYIGLRAERQPTCNEPIQAMDD